MPDADRPMWKKRPGRKASSFGKPTSRPGRRSSRPMSSAPSTCPVSDTAREQCRTRTDPCGRSVQDEKPQVLGSRRAGLDDGHHDQCHRHLLHVLSQTQLVNTAGRAPTHVEEASRTKSLKFWEADEQAWTTVITTNVIGTFYMSCLLY